MTALGEQVQLDRPSRRPHRLGHPQRMARVGDRVVERMGEEDGGRLAPDMPLDRIGLHGIRLRPQPLRRAGDVDRGGERDHRIDQPGERGPRRQPVRRVGGGIEGRITARRQDAGQVSARRQSDHADPGRIDAETPCLLAHQPDRSLAILKRRGWGPAVAGQAIEEHKGGHAARRERLRDGTRGAADLDPEIAAPADHDHRSAVGPGGAIHFQARLRDARIGAAVHAVVSDLFDHHGCRRSGRPGAPERHDFRRPALPRICCGYRDQHSQKSQRRSEHMPLPVAPPPVVAERAYR